MWMIFILLFEDNENGVLIGFLEIDWEEMVILFWFFVLIFGLIVFEDKI